MTTLNELASRAEAAKTGGCFGIDTEIAYAINAPLEGIAKPYTASLDAAMELTEGMTDHQVWSIWNEALARCSKFGGDLRKDLARYFAAAALRVRASIAEEQAKIG